MTKRSKRLKSEKSKVKLKAKKTDQKSSNITNTSFKVKKILLREQLKQHSETEILSTRKLNIDVRKSIYIYFLQVIGVKCII